MSTRMGGTTAWEVIRWGLLGTVLFRLLAFAGLFFLASWVAMVFWGIVASRTGMTTVGYDTAVIATAGLWLVISPMAWLVAFRVKRGSILEF